MLLLSGLQEVIDELDDGPRYSFAGTGESSGRERSS